MGLHTISFGNVRRRIFRHSSFVIRHFAVAFVFLLTAAIAFGDPGRLYTQSDPAASGGIEGAAGVELTHALAVDHERAHVYRAGLTDGGKGFRFEHLPVGKYDLVLVSKSRAIYEGLMLGNAGPAPVAESAKHLATRIAVADSFFNRHLVFRTGFEGDCVFALVERIRDKLILKQSGEKLDSNLRRLEIIELEQAADDWQMVTTRQIYREEEPLGPAPAFSKNFHVSELGNIRVVDSVKNLGALPLPKP